MMEDEILEIWRAKDITKRTGWDASEISRLANLPSNPLPMRVLIGKRGGGFVIPEEFRAWLKTASVPWKDRESYERRR